MSKAEAEISALKASLRRDGPETRVVKEKPKSALEAMIPSTSTRGRKRGDGRPQSKKDEAKTLAMFNAFKSKLEAADELVNKNDVEYDAAKARNDLNGSERNDDDDDEEAALCDLHFIVNCHSCSNWTSREQDEDNDAEDAWLSHTLSFAKDRLGKDLEWKRKNEEELVVVDPRERAKELGVEGVAGDPKDKRYRPEKERHGPRARNELGHNKR